MELDNLGRFFKMAVDWKQKLGAKFQFYIEPKPREPCKHQYDYDAQTAIAFLYTYGLQNHFKLNIEPNHTTLAGHDFCHDIKISAAYDMLGSIDCNTGDELLGWDTDQFLTDDRKATFVMDTIIKMGGFKTGGLNFDSKVRRESTDLEYIFIAHIGSMDTFAKGLRNAAFMYTSGKMTKMVETRYLGWTQQEFAKDIISGNSSFEKLELIAMKSGEPKKTSGKQELFENVFNDELFLASQSFLK
jgi:xylose isomerase